MRSIGRFETGTTEDFAFWSEDGTGTGVAVHDSTRARRVFRMSATRGDASASCWRCAFAPRPGHKYSLSGWMRGERVPSEAAARLRLDFVGSKRPVPARGRAALEAYVQPFVEWGRTHGVPLYVGEFGLARACFDDGRGGLAWVSDMLDVLEGSSLSFTYHSYHDEHFGIFWGQGRPTLEDSNRPLMELFTSRLSQARARGLDRGLAQ